MALLDVLGLPPLRAGVDREAMEAARTQWQATLTSLAAASKAIGDVAVKTALAGELRQAQAKVARADASADAAERLELYRSAATQLQVAMAVAKPAAGRAGHGASANPAGASATSKPIAAPASNPPATESTASAPGAAGAAGAKPAPAAPPGTPFSFSVPKIPSVVKKSVSVGPVKLEIKIKPTFTISGTAEVDDSGSTDLAASSLQLAADWFEATGQAQLSSPGLLGNLKLERKGASAVVTTSTQMRLGRLSLTFTIAGLDGGPGFELNAKASAKLLEAEGKLEPAAIKLGDQEVSGIKFHKLEVRLGGKITVAPEWGAMVVRWAIEKTAKEAAAEAGEAIAVAIGADVVIAGSLIVGGVATIAGGILAVVQGWGIADLAQSYSPAVAAAQGGFKSAMQNGGAPGDRFGKVGYDHGRRNWQALFDRTRNEHPEAKDDAIHAAIAAKADDALAQVRGAIDGAVRRGMWFGYLGQHTTALDGNTARWAYVACFGNEPNSKSPDASWKAYLDQHPKLAFMSPK